MTAAAARTVPGMLNVLVGIALALTGGTSFAQVQKCTAPNGRVVYQDFPCEGKGKETDIRTPLRPSEREDRSRLLHLDQAVPAAGRPTQTAVPTRRYSLSPKAPSRCLNGDAPGLRQDLDQMTIWTEHQGGVTVQIRPDFWQLLEKNEQHRRAIVAGIANADACISGEPRSILVVDPSGKRIGSASPTVGITY